MKYLFNLTLFLFLVSSPLILPDNSLSIAHRLPANSTKVYSISELNLKINFINRKLYQKFGIESLYISGGSSRAILDHLYFDKKLSMRDLDLAVILGKKVTPKIAKEIAQLIESELIGDFSEKDLRERPRIDPKAKNMTNFLFNAGYGFFWKKGDTIIDLSIFHSKAALRTNGILNIDRVLIEVPHTDTFYKVVKSIKGSTPSNYHDSKYIDDLKRGYQAWVDRSNIMLSNERELEVKPHEKSIRIIRAMGKIDALDNKESRKLYDKIKTALTQSQVTNDFQILRALIKLFEDKNSIKELQRLFEINFFKNFSPELHNMYKSQGADILLAKIEGLISTYDKPIERCIMLLTLLPKNKRLKFLKNLFKIDIKSTLNLVHLLIEKDKGTVNIGYFTGEYAPFHNGHLKVAKTPIEHKVLDFVFILPTPHPSNGPKTRDFSMTEWSERISFTETATANENLISVFPNITTYHAGEEKFKLSDLLANTVFEIEESNSSKWAHIMGADSFHRVVARKLISRDPRPRLIIQRPGIILPEPLGDNVIVIKPKNFKPISATFILHELAAKKKPKNIDPKVIKLVESYRRYQKIISNYADGEILNLIQKSKSIHPTLEIKNTYIIDTVENHDGLFKGVSSAPEKLQFVIDALSKRKKQVLVYIDDATTPKQTIDSYHDLIQRKKYKNVSVTHNFHGVPQNDRIRVIHSGIANNYLNGSYLSEKYNQKQGIVIYETRDLPLSPLYELTEIEVIKEPAKKRRNKTAPMCKEIL